MIDERKLCEALFHKFSQEPALPDTITGTVFEDSRACLSVFSRGRRRNPAAMKPGDKRRVLYIEKTMIFAVFIRYRCHDLRPVILDTTDDDRAFISTHLIEMGTIASGRSDTLANRAMLLPTVYQR